MKRVILSEEQLGAVTSSSQKTMVLAGAGSGKTAVIVARYGYLLRNGSEPNDVVILTFTVKAASELKARIADCGLKEPEFVGTIHGWCVRFLPNGYAIAPDRVSKMAEEWVCEVMPGEAFPSPNEIAALNIETTSRAYKAYAAYLLRNGMYDFDMLLKLALASVSVAGEVSDLIVDEYQDTGPVEKLIFDSFRGNKFIVGDTRQSLYGFRGASEWDVDGMAKDGWVVYHLTPTYRCTSEICDRVNRIQFNAADQGKGSCPDLFPIFRGGHVTDGCDPVAWIHEHQLIDATILCRSNREVQDLERRLEESGFPVLKAVSTSDQLQQYTDWLACSIFPENNLVVDLFLRRWSPRDHEAALHEASKHMVGIAAVTTVTITSGLSMDREVAEMVRLYPDDLERLAALYSLRHSSSQGPGFRVMTVHQAKGLEWANVCVVLPNWFKDSLENKRILYVAMTRCSSRLHMATSHIMVVPAWVTRLLSS